MAKPARQTRHTKTAGPTKHAEAGPQPKRQAKRKATRKVAPRASRGPKKCPPRYLPTPEEIKVACAEIRQGWSRYETVKRAGLDPGAMRWTPPEVSEPVLD